jgi:hypothetical protein
MPLEEPVCNRKKSGIGKSDKTRYSKHLVKHLKQQEEKAWLTDKINPPHPLTPSPTRGEGGQE